jgi:DNA-directed RNA polymerase subunit RPC12/RpoP
MAEIFCIHCGGKNLPEARFCQACGKPIIRAGEAEAPVVEQSSAPLECPYCEQKIDPAADVTQLICIQCAAALEVKRDGPQIKLEILRFP